MSGMSRSRHHPLWVPLTLAWLLTLLSFSVPGREGPTSLEGLDMIALAKVASRALAVLLLSVAVYHSWQHPRRPALLWALTPAALFAAWCVVSTLWSPLKSVSLGQSAGFVCLLLLTFVIGLRWRGPQDTSTVLMHLSILIFVVSATIVAIDMVSHEASGLSRERVETYGAPGLVHPNSAGATASLGLLVLLSARVLWGWRWTKILLVPGILAHGSLLYLAASRTALAAAVFTILLALAFFTSRAVLGAILLAASLAVAGYLVLDPGVQLAEQAGSGVAAYARRGSSDEEISSLTGRTEMWQAIWNSYLDSPLIGHGYFVSSRTGQLDVWSGPANHTAHNMLLQVLVSTGLIGLALFFWSLVRPVVACARALRGDPGGRALGAFLAVVWIWYLAAGMLESTFMGPVEAAEVIFFTSVGLALGYLPAEVPSAVRQPALVPAVEIRR